jgi:cobalt-zinc-cadmium efflux system protein
MSAAHAHSHAHAHGHAHAGGDFSRAFVIGIGLNLAFVAIEAFYGWQADSLALLADAGHNLSDVAGLALAWGAVLAGKLRPTARYTWGRTRASILAAFSNAVILLVAMGSLGWEAIGRIGAPPPVPGLTVMIVAGIGIVINLGTAMLFMGGQHDLNVRGAFLHMAADALVSVGVVVAGALAYWFGWEWVDPVASLLIAVFIVVATWGLFRQSLHLLFDGVPQHIDLQAVRRDLEALPGVAYVHDLHVWAAGTSQNVLTAQLVMPDGHPGDAFLQEATQKMLERFRIGHVTLQVVSAPFTTACDAEPCEPVVADHP